MEEEGVKEGDLVLINSISSDEEAASVMESWIQSRSAACSCSSSSFQHKLKATTVESFAVSFLNYIRFQASPFLQHYYDYEEHGVPPQRKYDDEYPALASNPTPKQKQARRVNPTPTTIPEVHSSFLLPNNNNNIENANLRAAGPVKVDMDLLMNRFHTTRNHRHRDRARADDVQQQASSMDHHMANSTAIDSEKSINSESKLKDDFVVCNGKPQLSSQVPCIPSKLCGELKRLAIVHAKLIMSKMVPSLLGELYFLLQLLSFGGVHVEEQDKLDIAGRLFMNYTSCSYYACKTLEQAAKLLDCVGEQVLVALVDQPAISCFSPSLLSRLRGALAEHQSAALRSFKAYESAYGTKCALLESPNKFTVERPPKHLPMALPTSLPFQAARDSRNNFRTAAFQKLYNNREQCRDQFYAIIRDSAMSQSAFGFASFGNDSDAYIKLYESVQSFLKMLMVQNYPWFAELFVEQYLQASSYGETDPEVAGLARHDPAKLQRLHDRLTSESTNQPPIFLSQRGSLVSDISDKYCTLPNGNSWRKAKHSQSSNVLLLQIANKSQENVDFKACLPDGFSKAFPQSTRIYIVFLEAADSYRLNSQLFCSIRSKIYKLTRLPLYSHDVADIGSGFTQRVLSLKALGSLMGFLSFYPDSGSLPPIPLEAGYALSNSESDVPRCYIPINLLEELDNARSQESLLLVLPWILDFLGMMKVVPSQASQSYFEQVFSSLKSLYSLPMLDPSNSEFGVSSICILATLDSFFEDIGILKINCSSSTKAMAATNETDKARLNKNNRVNIIGGHNHKSIICGGIDRMLGIIDTSYIHHCCPLLMAMRSVLLVAQKGWKALSPCSQTQRNYVRKITPIRNSRQWESLHASNNMLQESNVVKNLLDSDKDQLKLQLQHAFLEQRPHLQRLVNFIVDTTAVNAAHAASLRCVPQVLEDAMNELQIAIMDRFSNLFQVQSVDEFENMLNSSNFEASLEHIISTAIQRVLPAAIEYAKQHSAVRIVEALSALAAPDESPYVLSVAGGIASEATAIAVHKKALAIVSSEIRKRITNAVDDWRRKIQKQITKESKLLLREELYAVGQLPSVLSSDFLSSSCISLGTDLKHKEATLHVSTSMLFVYDNSENMMGKDTYSEQTGISAKQQFHFPADRGDVFCGVHTGVSMDDMALNIQRIAAFCHKVADFCLHGTLLNDAQNLVRLHLASVCNQMEIMLSKTDKGLPVGGFDVLVFGPDQILNSCIFLDEADNDPHRIENGLIRRSVALSAYWCLIFPWTAFGFTPEQLAACHSDTVHNIDLREDVTPCLELAMSQTNDATSECHKGSVQLNSSELAFDQPADHEPVGSGIAVDGHTGVGSYYSSIQLKSICQRENNEHCPMKCLVFMWKSLVETGFCKLETIVFELFSPWRWQLALHKSPWDDAPSWFDAVAHGLLKTMDDIAEIGTDKTSAWKLLCKSFEGIYQIGFYKANNLNEEECDEKRVPVAREARKLLEYISTELKKFQSIKCLRKT